MSEIKTKNRVTLGERFYYVTEWLFEMIKNSFIFWLYCIKGFFLFSLSASIEALTLTSTDVMNKERKSTFGNFKSHYINSNVRRLVSVVSFFFIMYTIVLFTPILQINGTLLFVLRYLFSILSLTLLTVLFTRTTIDNPVSPNYLFSVHIYFLMKHYLLTLSMLIALIILIMISNRNIIFFISLFPGLFSYITSRMGAVISEKERKALRASR